MNKLINEVKKLQKTKAKKDVEKRLKEFDSFEKKHTREWFSELCYCILTANSKGKTAFQIQKKIGADGFCKLPLASVRKVIKDHKHRFHNNKSKFIVEARKHIDIKNKISGKDEFVVREWLVENIKGFGYKEASHFLRNVGFKNIAILDRHVINLMLEYGIIKQKPKSLNRKTYLEIEKKFSLLAKRAKMSPAETDLYLWSMKTGEVLK